MKCPRCGNTDPAYFHYGSKGFYCRRCIRFGRMMVKESSQPAVLMPIREGAQEYLLQYPLTPAQKEVSHACASAIAQHQNVLIKAVCGAGKTELTVESISDALRQGKKVCFAIARRQVVLELAQRLSEIFPRTQVIAVCGGHTQVIDCSGIIVCTTHQLYRYTMAFDLLILDEPDAFPFKGDPVLHGIADNACRGSRIYLTATPDEHLSSLVKKKQLLQLELNRRPHGHDLPVPVLKTGPLPYRFLLLLQWIRAHKDHPRMVFVPTIVMAHRLHAVLNRLFPCYECTSRTEDRDEVIAAFRKEEAGLIVATTVLERGVTVPGADICIWNADHGVFDEAGLIQMAGRAGRSFKSPDGDVLFLLSGRSALAEKCRDEIVRCNRL